MSYILSQLQDKVMVITLNRADKFNSFNREMALALEDFVVRDHKHAVTDLVQESLERMQRDLMLDVEAIGKAGITEAATRYKKKVQESIRKGVVQEVRRAARNAQAVESDNDSHNDVESDGDGDKVVNQGFDVIQGTVFWRWYCQWMIRFIRTLRHIIHTLTNNT